MTRIDPAIIALYDRFTHGEIDRRRFLEQLGQRVGSAAAALALLEALRNDYALAETIRRDDPRLVITERQAIPSGEAGLSGYSAIAKGATKCPALLVIHENRGLNPHIKDVTRRAAIAGYLALGIDVLSPDGGTPTDEDAARGRFAALDRKLALQRIVAATHYLKSHPRGTGKVGAMGFCWGGGMVNLLAAAEPELDAGIAYYGIQVPADQVPAIRAPLLLHYAGRDDRINAGIPAYRAALEAAGKTFELHLYEGVDHAFNNDTNAARYNADAATLAWSRSLAFLAKYLGPPAATL